MNNVQDRPQPHRGFGDATVWPAGFLPEADVIAPVSVPNGAQYVRVVYVEAAAGNGPMGPFGFYPAQPAAAQPAQGLTSLWQRYPPTTKALFALGVLIGLILFLA
ncbi:hypothetical protein B7435_16765 [Mycolicibacterium peregrinum]|uniref:Uncharacterized protein n=1 Tax=Mycolicibacterium alvei TaxID=67081 RepID=A0A6N4V3K5_9MYCO|nr:MULTISPECIES: hypothetical protein [Mycolicibacterium]MCV7003568.1 hypothetical protein [Mycolicibacterium alvei]OWM01216.1 hypothetical protein B7435_16765 [Mycolicibacterium peregrinum]BBX30474.1 hypothetical protein MALV_55990 [Mycolicibacterium alvei]